MGLGLRYKLYFLTSAENWFLSNNHAQCDTFLLWISTSKNYVQSKHFCRISSAIIFHLQTLCKLFTAAPASPAQLKQWIFDVKKLEKRLQHDSLWCEPQPSHDSSPRWPPRLNVEYKTDTGHKSSASCNAQYLASRMQQVTDTRPREDAVNRTRLLPSSYHEKDTVGKFGIKRQQGINFYFSIAIIRKPPSSKLFLSAPSSAFCILWHRRWISRRENRVKLRCKAPKAILITKNKQHTHTRGLGVGIWTVRREPC